MGGALRSDCTKIERQSETQKLVQRGNAGFRVALRTYDLRRDPSKMGGALRSDGNSV